MTYGFIMIRHVNNKISDLYWKECYTCIRKWYDEPILIIDDSSNKEYVHDNLQLVNCTIIYDTEHKGSAEFLPYYYFHKLKPFDTAIILHDCVFLQRKIDFRLEQNEGIRFFWTFNHGLEDPILLHIDQLLESLPNYRESVELFNRKTDWIGSFGAMSVLHWDFLNKMNDTHSLFETLLPKIKNRNDRCAMERVFPLLAHFHQKNIKTYFGDIHEFIPWGSTFFDYLRENFASYPIVRVWSGR